MRHTDTTPPPAGPTHDLTREQMVTLAEAARLFPSARLGRRVHASTVWRWCRRGVMVGGIGRVRLDCVRLSGRWLTSREAISRFAARQTPAAEPAPVRTRTPGQRRKACERASRELDRLGI